MPKIKIVFCGTSEFALASLEVLHKSENIEILSVVTQPDRPAGRKQELLPPPVKVLAEELNLQIEQPENKTELEDILQEYKADFFIVISYGMILTDNILKMPKIACLNTHASILPHYRGASPIQQSLLNGDSETGVSFIKMDSQLDHGDIYLIKRVKIDHKDDFITLSKKLAISSALILPTLLIDIKDDFLTAVPQNHKQADYCKKITKEMGKVDFNKMDADTIINMHRAFIAWPGIHTKIEDKNLKLLKVSKSNKKIIDKNFLIENHQLFAKCKKGTIKIEKLQMEGKKAMDTKEFLNGFAQLFQ